MLCPPVYLLGHFASLWLVQGRTDTLYRRRGKRFRICRSFLDTALFRELRSIRCTSRSPSNTVLRPCHSSLYNVYVCVRACVRACVSESLPVCVCVSSILGPGRPPLLPHCFSARSLTVGLSALCCCVCVTYFERRLTPLFVASERDAWQMGSTPGSVVLFGSLPARARK